MQHQIPKELTPRPHRCENLKTRNKIVHLNFLGYFSALRESDPPVMHAAYLEMSIQGAAEGKSFLGCYAVSTGK
jgi:hypothetical protein